jgi:hypothetical protein
MKRSSVLLPTPVIHVLIEDFYAMGSMPYIISFGDLNDMIKLTYLWRNH